MTDVRATAPPSRQPAAGGHRHQDHRHDLAGVWRNQLGSELVLHADGFGGLSGSFHTGTHRAEEGAAGVTGSYDTLTAGSDCVLAFTVKWSEAHGFTVWAGRYRGGDGTIQATWLMTVDSEPEEEWRSTVIGHDVFHRVAPA